ncbi:Ethanolaminephosphotransferase 1, partial [Stegodyphus mimosarum]
MYYQYLSPERMRGFENYKYSAIDTNPLSNYVMHPFWNQVVKLVPTWLAPNVLTFTGFLLTLLNAILLAVYDYNFCASSDSVPTSLPIPQWVWLVCAINHFLAHTLDGIDGKHARRTNSSGPLGELMDHGLDSWTALFMPTCMYSVFGCGEYSCSPLRVFFILWSVHLCFIFSHWEKYNTGVLYLPWGYDISQMVLLLTFLVTYFKSYRYWKFTVPFLNIGSGEVIEILIYG